MIRWQTPHKYHHPKKETTALHNDLGAKTNTLRLPAPPPHKSLRLIPPKTENFDEEEGGARRGRSRDGRARGVVGGREGQRGPVYSPHSTNKHQSSNLATRREKGRKKINTYTTSIYQRSEGFGGEGGRAGERVTLAMVLDLTPTRFDPRTRSPVFIITVKVLCHHRTLTAGTPRRRRKAQESPSCKKNPYTLTFLIHRVP